MALPTLSDDERERFADFERTGWDEVAQTYAQTAETITAQVADPLLDAAQVARGDHVLDVASGPGFTAAAAAVRGAVAVGLDVSEAMAAEAGRRNPGISFEVAPAESMPFDDGTFDAVVSAFGMPHFADHASVFAEAHRVLRPGGRLAVASWNPPGNNPFFAVALGSIAQAGSLDVEIPTGVDMFSWADDEPCRELFAGAGFGPHTRTEVELRAISDDGPGLILRMLENASVRSRALYQAQTGEAKQAIAVKIRELLAPMHADGTWTIPLTAFVLSATRD